MLLIWSSSNLSFGKKLNCNSSFSVNVIIIISRISYHQYFLHFYPIVNCCLRTIQSIWQMPKVVVWLGVFMHRNWTEHTNYHMDTKKKTEETKFHSILLFIVTVVGNQTSVFVLDCDTTNSPSHCQRFGRYSNSVRLPELTIHHYHHHFHHYQNQIIII